jgi:hypothetical protein
MFGEFAPGRLASLESPRRRPVQDPHMEAAMKLLALLSLAVTVLLCGAVPARGQELPEGKGKEMVAASCNSCHPFYARVGAG